MAGGKREEDRCHRCPSTLKDAGALRWTLQGSRVNFLSGHGVPHPSAWDQGSPLLLSQLPAPARPGRQRALAQLLESLPLGLFVWHLACLGPAWAVEGTGGEAADGESVS